MEICADTSDTSDMTKLNKPCLFFYMHAFKKNICITVGSKTNKAFVLIFFLLYESHSK